MRRHATIAGVLVSASLLCACGAGAPRHVTTPAVAVSTAPPASPAAIVDTAASGCSTAVTGARPLHGVTTASVPIGFTPFGVAATAGGSSFVSGLGSQAGEVAVMSAGGLPTHVARRLDVPGPPTLGAALTPDGDDLLLARGDGIAVVDARRAQRGQPGAVLGTASAPGDLGAGAIEVTSTRDGRYAFVSAEDDGRIDVFDLRAILGGRSRSAFVGSIPVQVAPVGLAVSPDGRWLYETSEVIPGRSQGALSVIDVASAEHDPARAVVSTVTAGCQPVRVAVSPDGGSVYVTARASDALLRFSAAALRSDPRAALRSQVRVGEAPVGLSLVDGGRLIVVADSDRFGAPGQHSALSVVQAAGAQPRVLGELPAGPFPRDMALTSSGTLLVSDYGTEDVQAIDTATLPGG